MLEAILLGPGLAPPPGATEQQGSRSVPAPSARGPGWDREDNDWGAYYAQLLEAIEPGEPHYYRIQGPRLLVEYDNTQRNVNHVHSVWRDPDGDFGDDVLARHYREASSGHGHS